MSRSHRGHWLPCAIALLMALAFTLAGCSGSTIKKTPTRTGVFLSHYWTTNMLEANTDCGRRGLAPDAPYPDPIRGKGTGTATTADPHTATLLVGFDHFQDGDCTINNVLRGAVQFDLASRKGTVFQALLNFRTTTTDYNTVTNIGKQLSCASALKVADADFTSTTIYDAPGSSLRLPAVDYYALPIFDPAKGAPAAVSGVTTNYVNSATSGLGTPEGMYFTVNVTGQVNEWLTGASPNNGFVLAGYDEDTGAAENRVCLSYYDGLELDLYDLT